VANNAGLAGLREMIDRLREVSTVPEQLAPMVADAMKDIATENIQAARGPDGAAWPTRKDGSKSHVGSALGDISTRAVGSVATMTVRGVSVFRHFGAQGRDPRRILFGNIAGKLGRALRNGAIELGSVILKKGKKRGKARRR
jgi:hypothetical protein